MVEPNKAPVGTFVSKQLVEKKRAVAATRNTAGYAAIYAEIAKEVLAEYPALTADERAAVFGVLTHDAELERTRAGIDSTMSLREASRRLGIAAVKDS